MKTCPKCKEVKSPSEFNKCKSKSDGLTSNCKSCRSIAAKEYYVNNRSEINSRNKDWASRNKDKVRAKGARAYHRNKHKAEAKATKAIRKMISRVLALSGDSKTSKSELLIGYTKKDLVEHLEKQFENWMSWDNHGEWHIDHVTPISWYNNNGIKDPKIINRLENLRPLRAEENIKKGAKIEVCNYAS